jgi:hypothetical protein
MAAETKIAGNISVTGLNCKHWPDVKMPPSTTPPPRDTPKKPASPRRPWRANRSDPLGTGDGPLEADTAHRAGLGSTNPNSKTVASVGPDGGAGAWRRLCPVRVGSRNPPGWQLSACARRAERQQQSRVPVRARAHRACYAAVRVHSSPMPLRQVMARSRPHRGDQRRWWRW